MKKCESRNNHSYAVVVQDLATQWIQSYPCRTKTSQETQRSLQKFLEPDWKLQVIYTDNSLEFGKACEDLSRNHCTSKPHRSETNGIAERAVRRVKEGTSALLLQSGLNESWWADSMECYTYLRNVTDLLSDGKTPYERRFGQPFNGPIIPFGSLVEYHPITAKDQSRIHQFGKKSYLDCSSNTLCTRGESGRVTYWSQTLRSWKRWTHRKSTRKDSMRKRWYFPNKENLFFPIADGRIKPFGGDQDLTTSTFVRQRPIQGESHIDFLGESEGSLPPLHDSFPDAGEAINDFWSMSGNFKNRHHVEPRVELYSPREESFPILQMVLRADQHYLSEKQLLVQKSVSSSSSKFSWSVGARVCSEIGNGVFRWQTTCWTKTARRKKVCGGWSWEALQRKSARSRGSIFVHRTSMRLVGCLWASSSSWRNDVTNANFVSVLWSQKIRRMGDVQTVWTTVSAVEETREDCWRPERRTKHHCSQDIKCDHERSPERPGSYRNWNYRHQMSMRVRWSRRVTAGHDGRFGLALPQSVSSGVSQMYTWDNNMIWNSGTHQVGILGHVQKLRMVIVPRECPVLIGLDDTASWTQVRNFPAG